MCGDASIRASARIRNAAVGSVSPVFTSRGLDPFTALFIGMLVAPGRRTVCGMLTGSGMATLWHHSRMHRLFATTRWSLDQVVLIVLSQ